MLPKPKAIIFDWDNTLVDTWPLIHLALTETMQAMGHEPWSLEVTKKQVHLSMREAFPILFGERWQEAAMIYQRNYRQPRTLEKLTSLPFVEELLTTLKKQPSLLVSIVSNKMGDFLRKEVQHLQWNEYFYKVIGAQDAKEDKPSIAPLLLALEGSNIQLNKEVWFVGDSLTDMECAHNAGCTPIFYGEDDPTHSRYAHCPPLVHYKNHLPLIEMVEKAFKA